MSSTKLISMLFVVVMMISLLMNVNAQVELGLSGTTQYGSINTAHTQTVPNYNPTNTIQYVYFFNNLPITTPSILTSIAILYSDNTYYSPAQLLATPPQVRLHITRPDDPAVPNTLRFLQSINITLAGSGTATPTPAIYLRVGDVLAITVPNNRSLVRVGANNQGAIVSYGSLSVSVTSTEADRVGTIVVASTGGSMPDQLCGQFITSTSQSYGRSTTINGDVTSSLSLGNYHFLTTGISPPSKLRSVSVGLVAGSLSTTVQIVVGRPVINTATLLFSGLQWQYSYTTTTTSNNPTITLPSPFQLLIGDVVGVAIGTGGRALLANQLPSGQTYADYFTSSTSFVSGVTTSSYDPATTTVNYVPKINFIVDVTSEAVPQQCSQGYWKNHVSSWSGVTSYQFTSSSTVQSMFTNVNWNNINFAATKFTCPNGEKITATTTLIEALNLGSGGMCNVYRQAVAAYLDWIRYGTLTTSVWSATAVRNEFNAQITSSTPTGTTLESWARFCESGGVTATPSSGSGNAPPGGVTGDPIFAGFQGQHFQFHGLADEFFNLISSPTLQLNSHFVYLSSGRCDYSDTPCFSHPGTYLDELGFSIPSENGIVQIRVMAGSHAHGLRVFMGRDIGNGTVADENEIKPSHGQQMKLAWAMNNQTRDKASVHFSEHRSVTIETPTFRIKVINSDYFFNLEIAVLDNHLLKLGAAHHKITDKRICDHHLHAHLDRAEESEDDESVSHASHDHGLVEKALFEKYGVDVQLHGLIGQTWRNVQVCGSHWVGVTNDYIVSDLFGSNYFYNFFSPDDENEQHSY